MPLTSAQRTALVTALRLRAGISDTDPRIRQAALTIRDSGATNTTSSTVRVQDDSLTIVGNSTGTDTYGLSSDTIRQLMQAIELDLSGAGVSVEVIAPDDSQPASELVPFTTTSILDSTVTLFVQSSLLLEQLVDESLARLERYCRTALADDGTTVISRTLWPERGGCIVLEDARIRQVDLVAVDSERALRVVYTGSGRATVEVTDDQVVVQVRDGATTTETTEDLAGNAVSDIVTTLAGISGMTASTTLDGPATLLVRMPPERVTAGTDLWSWQPGEGSYRLDRDAGVVYADELRASYGGEERTAGQAFVQYRAGFGTLPADLEGVLLTVAKAGLDAQRRDAGLQSESLGDYSWTAAAGSVPAAAMDEAMMAQAAVLDTYRRMLP